MKRIRKAREKLNWTQQDLAVASGLQPAAIAHFETGRRSPSCKNLIRLAKALSASTDWLLELSNVEPLEVIVGGVRFVPAPNVADETREE